MHNNNNRLCFRVGATVLLDNSVSIFICVDSRLPYIMSVNEYRTYDMKEIVRWINDKKSGIVLLAPLKDKLWGSD